MENNEISKTNLRESMPRLEYNITLLKKDLKTEQLLSITSGQIVISDACCFKGDKVGESLFYHICYDSLDFHLNARKFWAAQAKKHPEREEYNSYPSELNEIRAMQRRIKLIPSINPPYLLKLDDIISFTNGIGDGNYPVIQTSEGYDLVINYPLKKGKLDESRLKGEIKGFCPIDSGFHAIADYNNCHIEIGSDSDSYCILKVPIGRYSFKFNDENQALSIRRVV